MVALVILGVIIGLLITMFKILSSSKKKVKEIRTIIHQYVDENGDVKEREEKQIVETERGVTLGEALLKICLVGLIGFILLMILMVVGQYNM